MSHTPNELAVEFPDHIEQMSQMKQTDAHFAKLFEDYHDINRQVHRAETLVEPTDDLHENEMRRQRLTLKDEIWKMLSSTS